MASNFRDILKSNLTQQKSKTEGYFASFTEVKVPITSHLYHNVRNRSHSSEKYEISHHLYRLFFAFGTITLWDQFHLWLHEGVYGKPW